MFHCILGKCAIPLIIIILKEGFMKSRRGTVRIRYLTPHFLREEAQGFGLKRAHGALGLGGLRALGSRGSGGSRGLRGLLA